MKIIDFSGVIAEIIDVTHVKIRNWWTFDAILY